MLRVPWPPCGNDSTTSAADECRLHRSTAASRVATRRTGQPPCNRRLCPLRIRMPARCSPPLWVACVSVALCRVRNDLLLIVEPPGRTIIPLLSRCYRNRAVIPLHCSIHSNTMLFDIQVAVYGDHGAPAVGLNLPIGQEQVRRILLIMLVFQATSSSRHSAVYYPGSFRGSTSSVIVAAGRHYLKGLYYKNASGVLVLRPSGLTDVPGGVGMAGQYAALFGLYFFFTERRQLMRVTAAAATMMGVMAVYLSGVKAAMICLVLGLASFGIFLSWSDVSQRARGMAVWFAQRRGSPIQVLVLILGISVGGFFVA